MVFNIGSFLDDIWRHSVNARSVTGAAIGEHPSQLAGTVHYVVNQLFMPAKSSVPRLTGRMREIADELRVPEPELSGLVNLWAKSGDEAFRMLVEVEERRRTVPARYVTTVLRAAKEWGLPRENVEGWRNIRMLIEQGRASEHPMAQLLSNIYAQIDSQAQNIIPNYKTKPNYWPQYANKEYLEQIGEQQFRELLRARAPMLTDEELDIALEAVKGHPPRLIRDIDPIIRPSDHLLMRRRVTLPDEARLHPMDEAVLAIGEELTYLVDTQVLGWQGLKFWNMVKLLKGETLPPTVMDELPANVKAFLNEVGDVWKRKLPGKTTRGLGQALESIANYTMGTYPESMGMALRKGLASVGVIEMMGLSALPNLGQIASEGIIRGFGTTAKTILRGGIGGLAWSSDAEMLKWAAAGMGQSQVMSRFFDLAIGYDQVTSGLIRNPGQFLKNPVGATREILNSIRTISREEGSAQALAKASREFLRLTGFTSVEDYLRRISTGTVQEELLGLQRTLGRDPANAAARRALARGYGISGDDAVREFLGTNLNLREVGWTPQKLMGISPDRALELEPWERLYVKGIDQTQFNYMPTDFPIAWTHPWLASTVLQFRRYSYQQATKLVSAVFDEARHGNFAPLARMGAAAWGVGNLMEAMRAGVTGRDIVWVGGGVGFKREPEPEIARAGEVKGPLGTTLPEWMVQQLTNATAMGLFGLYTDALYAVSEGRPLLLASYVMGVYPAEAFNLVQKMAAGLNEALTGGERHPEKERFPKGKEALRYLARQVPFFGRIAYPHLRSAPGIGSRPLEYQRLREFGLRAWTNKDWEVFNAIQNRLTNDFENPITIEEAADYQMRALLKKRGLTGSRAVPGDPGYEPRREEERLMTYDTAAVDEKMRERLLRYLEGAGLEEEPE